jgi:hypothetical protein
MGHPDCPTADRLAGCCGHPELCRVGTATPYALQVERGFNSSRQPRDAANRWAPLPPPMAVTGAPERPPQPRPRPSPRPSHHDRDCDCNRCRYGNV